jgi:beta-galactosidase
MTLTTSSTQFLFDGKPFRILSGAMHYFRVVPEYWRDRLEKMRAFGLNTVETYVPWNLHEPRPGEFHFEGMLDIVKFIETANDVGLKVIVRPGPYICSEWDFGGLPAWLLKDPEMQVRCAYPPYLAAVNRYFDALLPKLAPLQSTQGGPIIAMQVENEYGSYGNDKVYLRHLADGMRSRGIDSFLFTSDGPRDICLQGGALPDVFKTVNFAFDAQEAFAKLREYQPEGPLMVMEFWSGWFDHWGEPHHVIEDGSDSIQRSLDTLDEILSMGASVNFYMFHGGTNFGFMNGANCEPTPYQADVTSYDYACPISESGDLNPRYAAYREVLKKYIDIPSTFHFPSLPKRAYGRIDITESVGLFESLNGLSQLRMSVNALPMEMYDQDYGFILYRTQVTGPRMGVLRVRGLHDRAQIFIDGELTGILDRESGNEYSAVDIVNDVRLDILVENMGRVNFGPSLMDRKGVTDGVTINDPYHFGWEVFPLSLSDLRDLKFSPLKITTQTQPTFYKTIFHVDELADTFLALPGWTKGVVWLNGFNLGRYWERGVQKTLYIPAPLLLRGENELIVFELHGTQKPSIEFRDAPELG